MEEEQAVGCTRPTGGPVADGPETSEVETMKSEKTEERNMIRVGKMAPDFTASAYHKGQFTEVKLSDFRGKWVALCFYPGDFTFV